MTEKLATFSQEDDISIITLDDGKANVFSPTMINWFKTGYSFKVRDDNIAYLTYGRN